MTLLISLLIIVAVVVVLIWLINQVPVPQLLKTLAIAIVVIGAIIKVFPLL